MLILNPIHRPSLAVRNYWKCAKCPGSLPLLRTDVSRCRFVTDRQTRPFQERITRYRLLTHSIKLGYDQTKVS